MLKDILVKVDSKKENESNVTENNKETTPRKNSKDDKDGKRNRPRIFSRDFNKLPVSCSPK